MEIYNIQDISFKEIRGCTHAFEGMCSFSESSDRITASTRLVPIELRRGAVGTMKYTEEYRAGDERILRECEINNVYLCDIQKERVETWPRFTYTFIKLDSLMP